MKDLNFFWFCVAVLANVFVMVAGIILVPHLAIFFFGCLVFTILSAFFLRFFDMGEEELK